MKNKYYIHRNLNPVKNYFGYIGPKVRVNPIIYWVMKLLGYRATKEGV